MQIILIIILFVCYAMFFNADVKKTVKICMITLFVAALCGIFFGIIRTTTLEIVMIVSLLALLRQAYLQI